MQLQSSYFLQPSEFVITSLFMAWEECGEEIYVEMTLQKRQAAREQTLCGEEILLKYLDSI